MHKENVAYKTEGKMKKKNEPLTPWHGINCPWCFVRIYFFAWWRVGFGHCLGLYDTYIHWHFSFLSQQKGDDEQGTERWFWEIKKKNWSFVVPQDVSLLRSAGWLYNDNNKPNGNLTRASTRAKPIPWKTLVWFSLKLKKNNGKEIFLRQNVIESRQFLRL